MAGVSRHTRSVDDSETLLKWARVFRPALILISVLAVLALVALGLQLRSQLRSFQEEPVDNIHWNVTQLELDIVRFQNEAQLMMLQPNASLKELRNRFDLFYSRAQSALHGRMFSQLGMQDIVAPMNTRVQDFLDTITPLIDSDDATLRRSLSLVLQSSSVLRDDLRTMSVDLIDKYAALADKRRAAFSVLVAEVAWAMAVLLAVLILLLALVLLLNHRAEINHRATERVSSRLSATVNTSLDAIIVAGRDGRIIDFNSAAVTLFGYDRDEAIGSSLADLIVPARFREAHARGMERMNRSGEMRLVNTGRFEISACRKGGKEFPIEISLSSSGTGDGMLIISYLRDISDRIAAEKAVLAARDEALAAEKAKTNFMAVMSHEMRTPLNGVMAALEIATQSARNPKSARFIQLARDSANQLLRHANDVLDVSKIDAGGMVLTEEDFDLGMLVRSLVAAQNHAAANKNTVLEVVALTDVPRLHGDSFRLGQIVQNLLSNAIKFTSNGAITLEFEVQTFLPDGVVIEIRVIDTGIGIAEADQARVFDDFVMINPAYDRNAGGTGLGLAISRRLARAMGGEIGVESEPGEGSCFWLRIPFGLGGQALPTESEPLAITAEPARILVVEDNATNRIVLKEMLAHLGHKVSLAVDGREGFELARNQAFDLILMDVSMPNMDGLTATRLIRRQGLSSNARIIAITAHSQPEDREKIRAAGMDDFLIKPISERALARAIAGNKAEHGPSSAVIEVLNPGRLAELSAALGDAGLGRMIDQFGRDISQALARLSNAASAGQGERMAQAAHEAAGACAMVGAAALHQVFQQVEAACSAGDLAMATDLQPLLAPLWQKTEAALPAAVQA